MNESNGPTPSLPDELTPTLRRLVPPGTKVTRTLIVRQLQLPGGTIGCHVEYPEDGSPWNVRLLAQGIETVFQHEAKRALQKGLPIITTSEEQLKELLRQRAQELPS